MFDIDGTLVDSAAFDGELYAAAVEAELGRPIDRNWSHYDHVSDSGILEQLLRAHGEAERVEAAARVQLRFVALISEYLTRHPALVREIAGAKRLVERLAALPNVRVAVATGGWEPTARLKLAHVGIDGTRLALASSSDARARTDIMRIAARRAMRGGSFACATYFGDGAWDRRASAELGYGFIAVGPAVEHDVAFADLRDTEAILARLGVLEGETASC